MPTSDDDNRHELAQRAADRAYKRGAYREAIEVYTSTLQDDPTNVSAAISLAQAQALVGNFTEALAQYRRVRSMVDSDDLPEILFSSAFVQNRLGEYSLAAAEVLEALTNLPRRHAHLVPDAWFILGNSYYMMGQYQRSIDAFESAVSHRPNFVQARRMLFKALVYSGQWRRLFRSFGWMKRLLNSTDD